MADVRIYMEVSGGDGEFPPEAVKAVGSPKAAFRQAEDFLLAERAKRGGAAAPENEPDLPSA